MSILFKKSNTTAVSKELFENLTKEQKKDMVSFKKMKFKSLTSDKTIVKCQLDQLSVIASYLRVIFQEDEHFNVHVLLVYKEKPKGFLCGKASTKNKTSVILNFVIKQEEILELLKENPETNRIFGEAIEFNIGKLVKILNKLFMSRSSNKA